MFDDLELSIEDSDLAALKTHALMPLMASIIFAGFQGSKTVGKAVSDAKHIVDACAKVGE